MDPQKKGERRQYPRLKLDPRKHCANISEGGLYVLTDDPRRLGSIVSFELKMHDDLPPLRGRGRVVRIIHKGAAGQGSPPGMALEFTELAAEDRDRIRFLLADPNAEIEPE